MSTPPTGTVAFLFADIEGSTKMWERDQASMHAALARHDEILRDAAEERGGYVFKSAGDTFCCAFSTATEALEAALNAQRTLLSEDWEETRPLRVRMALHTGVAKERDGDYFGPPVNRVKRLLSAAHGGQVLLSLAAQEMVRDGLPAGATLMDLGERHLMDLFRPEWVVQLVAPGLPSEFPPPRTLEARPNNLPLQPTPLVGREREVGEIAERVRGEEARLLTLTGPGGTGKTRLALQAGANILEEFEDGVFFVSLAVVTDPDLVPSAIAGPLGVKEGAGQPLEDSLVVYMREKELLLILDNFEQVLEGAPIVGELLGACPTLKVLATSRIPLGLYGEREYPVPPLALPDPRILPPLEVLTQYEAVRLFIERATAVSPDFSVSNESAPTVAEICARLDGLPLAIELAAARIRVLSPQKILQRLSERLKLLKGGARDLPTRQQTLRRAIDWSYQLLDEGEKTLFGRLSVFAGGRTLEAIEEICDLEGDLDALEGVESLVEKSLLRKEEGGGKEPRFVMLETIHEFAREKLKDSGEEQEVKRAHAEYFLALAEEATPELKGADQLEWLERLEAEHDNTRTALSWALESDEVETALRLGGALWWFWLVRGHSREGRRWLEEALARAEDAQQVPEEVRAKTLIGAGRLLLELGDPERATDLLAESVTLYRKAGHDKQGLADSLDNLGIASAYQGELSRAQTLFEESVELFREAGDLWGVAESLNNLALIAGIHNDRDQETALHEESLRIRRELGDKRGIVMSLINMAFMALKGGGYRQAASLCEEGLALGRALGDKGLTADLRANQGLALLNEGDSGRAVDLFQGSLIVHHEMGDKYHLHSDLMSLASAAVMEEKPLRAARLFGVAQDLRESTGIALVDVENGPFYERFVAAARSQIEEKAWERALQEGRTMPMQAAIEYALSEEESSTATPISTKKQSSISAPEHPAGLTPREVEVLALVAEGLTNAQIAERLFLSPRTVHSHLNSIYQKLGVSSRSAATRFAIEHDLA